MGHDTALPLGDFPAAVEGELMGASGHAHRAGVALGQSNPSHPPPPSYLDQDNLFRVKPGASYAVLETQAASPQRPGGRGDGAWATVVMETNHPDLGASETCQGAADWGLIPAAAPPWHPQFPPEAPACLPSQPVWPRAAPSSGLRFKVLSESHPPPTPSLS